MATRSNLEEILAIHGLEERDLDQKCSIEHREEFAKRIKNWKVVGAALGFTQEELDMIDSGFPSEEQKKTALLFQWSMRDKKEATYLNLAKLLFAGEQLDLLQVLCSIIAKATSTTPAESKDQYVEPRHQGALVHYQPEGQASETKISLQQILKSETNGATSIRLNEKDIIDLMKLLQSYSYKWNPIGLNLGFTPHELSTISCMVALIVGAPVSHLQELLSQWVQWPTNEHPNNPTLKALCSALRSPLVGLGSLAEDVEKEMKQCTTGVLLIDQYINDDNVADKIHQFEKQFKDLHKCIRMELVEKEGIDVKELLQSLTLLPTKLKNEYQEEILKKLPMLRKEDSIPELFLHLNPLFSFLDYTLLEYIIEEFGSAALKQKMQSYSLKVRNFMDQTTVRQLIDYWPCKEESAPKVSKMIAKIDKDPQLCKLSELDTLRKKICICVRLSDVICAVVSVSSSQSFVVVWRLPSVLAPDMIESLSEIDKNFFRIESIDLISIDNVQVYPELAKSAGAIEGVSQEPSMSVKQKHSLSLKKCHRSGKFANVRLDEDIQKFIVCGVPSENELGKGSWGSVKEIQVEGLLCVGKLFNERLFANETVTEVISKYVNVCRILSNLRHPNIIQFLGLCFLQDHSLPMIVTEKLEGNLHSLLVTVSNIPMMLRQSLLEDVARGLHYLHTFNPVITHGVLTARNVLYTSSLTAKITDISNTQLVKFQVVQALSVSMEVLSYMPSDAAYQNCGPKQDIFSFGPLALFTLTQVFPMKSDQQCHLKRQTSQSETEHRKQYIQDVERLFPGPNHSLTKAIKMCLHSDPKKRPTARQLLTALEETKATTEGGITRMNAARQVLTAKDIANLERELKETSEEHHKALKQLDDKDREIEELAKSKDKKIEELIELLESKDREIKQLSILNRAVQLQPTAAVEPDKQGEQSLFKNQDIGLPLLWGYFAKPREEPTPEGYTHDWTAFVKGETRADGHDVDIMHVVKKVVFQLHKDFEPNATRVVKKPPYQVSESGCGTFKLPVKIYFSNNDTATFKFDLHLYAYQVSTCFGEMFPFQNPSKNFREKLILAGGRPCQSPPTSQKRKSKKRTSEKSQPKREKKKRVEIDIETHSEEQPSSSSSEDDKNTPTSSDSSSDDEWMP